LTPRRVREKISGFTMRHFQSRKVHENLNSAQLAHQLNRILFSRSAAPIKFRRAPWHVRAAKFAPRERHQVPARRRRRHPRAAHRFA
jgi:hypothetical protein